LLTLSSEELNHERIESAISDRSINHKYEKNSKRINNYRISIDALFLYFKVNDINTHTHTHTHTYTHKNDKSQ